MKLIKELTVMMFVVVDDVDNDDDDDDDENENENKIK